MSYDLQVWTAKEPSLSEVLDRSIGWETSNHSWLYQRGSWAVIINQSVRALAEDLPSEVARALPGIGYLTELNLSPISASDTARKFLLRAATLIAKRTHGVILDPQSGTVTLPSGVQRFMKGDSGENASLICLSWWFTKGPLVEGNRYDLFLDILEAELLEALPRRYGTFEPPQHVFAEAGRSHFLTFLAEHTRGLGIVWYPTAPVADVFLRIPDPVGASKKGFRSARLEITIDADTLRQTGWQTALQRFWRRISLFVQPFYGDVRTLHGYRRSRGRYWITRETETHPVKVWWWAGLPPGPAQAIVLGEPYLALWNSFAASASTDSGYAFVDTEDWKAAGDVFDRIGPVPADLSQLPRRMIELQGAGSMSTPAPIEYPARWPFGPPRL